MQVPKSYRQINFWGSKQECYEFCNFFRAPIRIDDVLWPTSEHYYQAMKFEDEIMYHRGREILVTELVRSLPSARAVCDFCRNPFMKPREDWEEVKEDFMMTALRAKFSEYNYELMSMLIRTGSDTDIIEDSPYDYYWGCGKERTGRNRLGVLLMRLRWDLRNDGFYAECDEGDNPYLDYEWVENINNTI